MIFIYLVIIVIGHCTERLCWKFLSSYMYVNVRRTSAAAMRGLIFWGMSRKTGMPNDIGKRREGLCASCNTRGIHTIYVQRDHNVEWSCWAQRSRTRELLKSREQGGIKETFVRSSKHLYDLIGDLITKSWMRFHDFKLF